MNPGTKCEGPIAVSRRRVLQAGGIGLLGLSLPRLLHAEAQQRQTGRKRHAADFRQRLPGRRCACAAVRVGTSDRVDVINGSASRNGGTTRVDMIAAVLKRHRGLSPRELIAALDREFGWKSSESYVTGLLYTNQKKFAHTQPDRAANRLVTWSLK